MPHAAPTDVPQRFDRSRFWRLLPFYFIGAAIGCVLVGAILNAKHQFLHPGGAAAGGEAPRSSPSEPGAPQAPVTPAK